MSNKIINRPDHRDELELDNLTSGALGKEPVPPSAQSDERQASPILPEEPMVAQEDWGNWRLEPIAWEVPESVLAPVEPEPAQPVEPEERKGAQSHSWQSALREQVQKQLRQFHKAPAQPVQAERGERKQTERLPEPERASTVQPEQKKVAAEPQPEPAVPQVTAPRGERRSFQDGEVITLNLHRKVEQSQPTAEPQAIFDQDEEAELESMLARHAQEKQAREQARKAAEQQAAAQRAAAAKEAARQVAQQVAEARKAAERAAARERAAQEAAALRAKADRMEAQWAKPEQSVEPPAMEKAPKAPQPQPERKPQLAPAQISPEPQGELDFLNADASKAQQDRLEQEAMEEDLTLPKLAYVPELLRISPTEPEEPAEGSQLEQEPTLSEEETPLSPLEEVTQEEEGLESPEQRFTHFQVEDEDAELESMLSAHAGPVVQALHPEMVTLEPEEEGVEPEPQEQGQPSEPASSLGQTSEEPKEEETGEEENEEEEQREKAVQPASKKSKQFKKQPRPAEPEDEDLDELEEELEEDWEEDELADESLLEPPQRSPGLFRQLAGFVVSWIQSRPKGKTQDEEDDADQEHNSNVVEMPQERPSLLRKKWEEMEERVNDFADSMFQAESAEAEEEEERYKRAERYIPGTDEEEAPPRRPAKAKPVKKKKTARRAPDTSPKELSRIYYSSWKNCKGRLPFQLTLAVLLLGLSILATGEVPAIQIAALDQVPGLTGILLTVGLVGACLLGLDTLLEGVVEIIRGRPSLNSLSSIGVFLTLIDSVWYATLTREGPLPFCGFAALSLWAVAWGNCRKKQGLYLSCQMAAAVSQPQRLTLDQGKWDNKGTFIKETGSAKGFGSQIQEPDGAQRVYHYAAPVMMLACFLFGILAAVGQQGAQQLVWDWSVIYVLSTPLTATLAYGVPYTKLVKRLNRSGVILAGWDGVDSMKGEAGIAITDRDLFPEGYVQFKGIKNFGQVSLEKMTGCTASMIREMDTGLAKIFDDQIRTQGGFYRRVDELKAAEGGFSGLIRGDQVLVGCADYMNLMGVPLKQGYQVRNAVFCVINGQLQGIFSLNYALAPNVKTSLDALIHSGIHPILATRDFNITPVMLRQRFHLPTERMQYPPVDRRHLLSAKGQPHNSVLGALIYREGLKACTDAILGGRRLRTVVRLNTILALAASVVGALLGFYLAMMGAYYSLSPLNILFFLVMWLIPILLISNSVDQF